MWYKKVQVILRIIKRENLTVVAVAKRELIAKYGPVSLPFIHASSFKTEANSKCRKA